MGVLQLQQLQRAGRTLHPSGTVAVEIEDIVAIIEIADHSVLYLRSGNKILVKESPTEIERNRTSAQRRRELAKRFKREMRERKTARIPIDRAFATSWDELSRGAGLTEADLAALYQEMLAWTKRWLK